jgi:hypothetical protein
MRFFSNEAKDNVDDETGDRRPDPTEHPVPQQRAGSPWQHDTEPAPQPTAVGTSSVGDRADDPERTDRLPDTADRTVAFEDGATRDRADEAAWPATTDQDRDHHDRDHQDQDNDPDRQTVAAQGRTDVYRDHKDPVAEDRGGFDDPHLTQPIPSRTDTPVERTDVTSDGDRADDVTAAHDKADDAHDKAEAAEVEATEAKEQADRAEAKEQADKAEAEPLIAPAATPANTISGASSFFPAADTQPLRDRWRDVQLRFVDDPKGATSDAAGLVDEAVDKLVQGLREQRGALAKGTDDTESLRVELRSYRDILDRLLGL